MLIIIHIGTKTKNADDPSTILDDTPKVEEHRQRHRQESSRADLREPRKALFDADSGSSSATRGVRNILEMVCNLLQLSFNLILQLY